MRKFIVFGLAVFLFAGICAVVLGYVTVYPVETDSANGSGDMADDSCIWIHPTDPARA